MAERQFEVGDLVTRGRGRVTFRVIRTLPGNWFVVVQTNDKRTNPREIDVAGSNLRLAEEAKP